MNKKRIQTKDLITIGMFSAMYYVLFFAVGMLGYIPILYILLPFLLPIVCGIPFMLFLTKVETFGMITIMGIILGALMLLTGHTFTPLVTGFFCGLLADLVCLSGKYASKKLSILAYIVFSFWLLGMLLPFWIMRDSFEAMMFDSMGSDYTHAVLHLFEKLSWTFPILSLLGGLIGALFGISMVKKHFKRAAIV